ncbi:MAG: hypothetical protein F4X65_15770 [Chloroflexi bacterium]|nr:hypothetical protein [Chloroflexota bacterium]
MINRMAENSRSCKLWCITLVAATLVLVARTGEPQHALIALVPTLLFLFLDSYYLALERAFIKSQNAFVGKLHGRALESAELYRVIPSGMGLPLVMRCMLGSVSIWPFYLLVTVTIVLTWLLIIPSDTPFTGGKP